MYPGADELANSYKICSYVFDSIVDSVIINLVDDSSSNSEDGSSIDTYSATE